MNLNHILFMSFKLIYVNFHAAVISPLFILVRGALQTLAIRSHFSSEANSYEGRLWEGRIKGILLEDDTRLGAKRLGKINITCSH